jgi:hypothetical protein
MDHQNAIEGTATLKGLAVGSGPASAIYVTSQSCAVDYTSLHVFMPLIVSTLAGIYTLILIREKLKG